MLDVSPEQIDARLAVLSPKLQDAFYSYEIAKKIWGVAESMGLKNKRGEISGVIGYVLTAFLHPDALALELKEAVSLDDAVSKKLAEELNKKIITPYRAEIEKAYAPPGSIPGLPLPQVPPVGMPKMADVTPPPAGLPTIKAPAPAGTGMAIPSPKSKVVPMPPPIPAPAPVTTKTMPTVAPLPAAPKPTESKQANPAVPQPFIMRGGQTAEPVVKSSGFKIDLDSDFFKKTSPGASAKQPFAAPPRPAQLEMPVSAVKPADLSGAGKSGFFNVPEKISPEARVVHYSEPQIHTGIPAAPLDPAQGKPIDPAQAKPIPPAPAESAPKINPFAKAPLVPEAPKPAAPADLPVAPLRSAAPKPIPQNMPAAPDPSKPPKVVNFGPEGDLK